MKKYQPSGTTIGLFFMMAVIFLMVFLMTLYYAESRKLLGYCIMFGIFCVVFLILGIISTIFNIQSGKARDSGRNATCTVIDKRVRTNRYGRFPRYFMIVSFVGENGKYYEHQATVSEDFFCRAERGAKLRCRVYKNSCYIDPEAPVFAPKQKEDY